MENVVEESNKISKYLLKGFYIVIALGILFAVYYFYIEKYTVYLVDDEIVLNEGDIYQVKLLPKEAEYYDLDNYRFKSNNEDILFADNSGLIQGMKEGNAKVKVRYKMGLFSQKVNVKVEKVNIESIKLEREIEIEKNSTKRVKPIINNDEKINATLTYSTDNENILKVDTLGNITGLKSGSAKLIAESKNGKKAETIVKVKESTSQIEEIKFTDAILKINLGETLETKLDIYPFNANTDDIVYTSSNDEVIKVDYNGFITAKKEGYSVINAVTKNGLEANIIVTCTDNVDYTDEDRVVVSENNIIMYVGEERTIENHILPLVNDSKSKYLVSENSDIVSVSTGHLVAKKAGQTVVNVKTDNEELFESINVTVKDIKNDVEKVEINNDNNISLYKNNSIRLSATVSPESSTNKKIKWTSSNEEVAKITSSGILIGVKRGNAKIKAESHNGKSSTINVVVMSDDDLLKNLSGAITRLQDIKNIKINEENITINEGLTKDLVVMSEEEEVSSELFKWTSDNGEIVRVDSKGKIIALKQGNAVITAKTENNKTATANITVTEPLINTIEVPNIIDLKMGETYKIEPVFENDELKTKYNDFEYNILSGPFSPVIEVDQDGVVTSFKYGQTILEVIPKYNVNLKKNVIVNVIDPNLKNVKIKNQDFIRLSIGSKYQIQADFEPSNYENKKILYNVVSGKASIISGFSNGSLTMNGEGAVTIYVYPQANPKLGKNITFAIGYGFLDICSSKAVIEKRKIDKSPITGKAKTYTSQICLDNIRPMFQNIGISKDYIYGASPVHGWCDPATKKTKAERVIVNSSIQGNCTNVTKNNYINSSDARITARYLGGHYIFKIDRKTGRLVSKKLVNFAGHGQSFDVTYDNKLYINFLSNTDLTLGDTGKLGGGYSGVGFINGIGNEIDSKVIYPSKAVKVKIDGGLYAFKSNNTPGSANYNTDILKLSTGAVGGTPMHAPQLAVDETKSKIGIMYGKSTKQGNRQFFTYDLTKFMNAQKSGKTTVYSSRVYVGKVCGTSIEPTSCGGQGVEMYGKYLYTVQDYTYKGIDYANITKIDTSTCPKTDTNKAKCKAENAFLRKDKYYSVSSKKNTGIEIEGISIVNGKTYVSLYGKNNGEAKKSKIIYLNGF